MNEVIVTASYVSQAQRVQVPQVSITVRADFVVFGVTYETATRSPDARKDELARTFATLIQRAARVEGLTVEAGTPGRSAAIETTAIRELIEDDEDRSSIELVLKVMVRPNETFNSVRSRAETFIAEVPVAGRVEAVIDDNQSLGIQDARKHRDTLVRAIADDVRLMQSTLGPTSGPVSVELTGMESRAVTRPVGPLNLEIYIPYEMSVRAGRTN